MSLQNLLHWFESSYHLLIFMLFMEGIPNALVQHPALNSTYKRQLRALFGAYWFQCVSFCRRKKAYTLKTYIDPDDNPYTQLFISKLAAYCADGCFVFMKHVKYMPHEYSTNHYTFLVINGKLNASYELVD